MRVALRPLVSIPFIAGQWSLLSSTGSAVMLPNMSFNPLHCGAVVASSPSRIDDLAMLLFQSPSLRGSGRFSLA